MKTTIQQALQKALAAEGITDVSYQVSIPSDQTHGDFTSNVSLIAAKKLGKNPMEVGEGLKGTLSEMAIEGIRKIEVVKPGFINFWLDQEYIIAILNAKNGEKTMGDAVVGKKIMVEYTDPNPFKEFHIGHLFTNIIGESIARLFAATGNTVWRADFFGDVGMHAAKAVYGIREKLSAEGKALEDLTALPLEKRVEFMGQGYALGAKMYEEDDAKKTVIKQFNAYIFIAAQQYWQEKENWEPRVDYRKLLTDVDEALLQEIKELWITGRGWSLDYFETIYKRLGTKFDGYYPESLTGEWGYDFVMKGLEQGVFEKSDGAVVYKGEKKGLHTRVFINQLGLPTYETKDIGNAPMKYKDFPYDLSVIVTGNEINDYFDVVIAAMKEVNPTLGEKTTHIGHGMVDIKDEAGQRVKMSSRKGNVITGEWMLNTAKEKIMKAYPDMDAETAEKVAIGSVKYAFLKSSIGKNIEFSFAESISFEGNSGPYLQYTYVRTQSILNKPTAPKVNATHVLNPYHDDLEAEERVLLRTLFQFEEVVSQAATELAPSTLATYLFDLSQKFNNFYQKHKILESEQKVFRVGLTYVVGETIKQGLDLLGIPVPQKM